MPGNVTIFCFVFKEHNDWKIFVPYMAARYLYF